MRPADPQRDERSNAAAAQHPIFPRSAPARGSWGYPGRVRVEENLQLLLAREDGAPVLPEGLDAAAAASEGAGEAAGEGPDHLWEEGDDPNLLASQRWGVIAPQGPAGDRLLALVRPLIERRRAQQGAEVRVYRVPSRMDAASAVQWRRKVFEVGGGLSTELPRYQLLLGDLDQTPLSIQEALAFDGYPGRLAFTAEADYEAYVEKLLRWETGPRIRAAEALLCGVKDGSRATEMAQDDVIRPGVELLSGQWQDGYLDAAGISEVDLGPGAPSPDRLLARAAAARSAVLLTTSHGEGAPRGGWGDAPTQRARQGALCFGRAGALTGADLRGRAFLPGGLWCALACYGAGTPEQSGYQGWLERLAAEGRYMGRPEDVLAGLPRPGERPFVAALPQAALASPEGPIAFVGHVDLAWTYAFQDLDGRSVSRPGRLVALVRSALRGDRVGVGLRELARGVGMANAELTSLIEQGEWDSARATGPGEQVRRIHLWMLRRDLAGYVLLGDPAARLALPGGDEGPSEQQQRRAPEPSSSAGVGPEDEEDAALLRLEALIGRALAGEDPRALALDAELSEGRLAAALAAYREAGRAALRRLLVG